MTEEPERYDWETEDGTGAAVVSDASEEAPHYVTQPRFVEVLANAAKDFEELRERIEALEQWTEQDAAVDTLTLHRITALEVQTKGHTERLNRIQDANIAPMLESSAVIVELRGIRSAIEALTKSIDGVQEANVYGQWCIRTMPFGGDS